MKKALGQTVRDLKRGVNKKVLKVPGIEQKVLDATSNEPWGPHGSLLADIAMATRNYHEYQIIAAAIWKRISDTGKNWRHVYKGLTVLEYLVAHGSERIIDDIKEHAYQISSLSDFQYIDSSGRDQGSNIRKKSQGLVALVNDKERITEVRQKAAANKEKFRNSPPGGMRRTGSGGQGDRYDYDRYGSRDDYQHGYGKDKDYGYKDDDRHGRYSDSNSRDGDRYSRDHEDRSGRDGYRDDDYRNKSRSVDGDQYGTRSRSSDREHAFDDDDASHRGSSVRDDDYSQDGRRHEQKFSEQNNGTPPSYEEAVSASRSPAHSERYGETSMPAVPRSSSPPASNNPDQATSEVGNSASPSNKKVEAFDAFDPRVSGSAAPVSVATPAPAPPTASTSSEIDLLGGMSDSWAVVPILPETPAQSGALLPFSPNNLASNPGNQDFDDPFGDGPFKAFPSADATSGQQQISTSMTTLQPSMSQNAEVPHAPSVKSETVTDFNFADSFPANAYSATNASNSQPPSANLQFFPEELSAPNQENDILADIFPPSGPANDASSHTTLSASTSQGQHAQSGANPYGLPAQPSANPYGLPAQPSSNPYGLPAQSSANPYGLPAQSSANPYGQPAQPSANNPYGQPAQPTANPYDQVGQPSANPYCQPGQPNANGFGQPAQPNANAFGQPAQPNANAFGQPAQPSANPYSQPAQSHANPYGQAAQPHTNPYGQPTQPHANPYGQPTQPHANPYGQPAQPNANPYGQPTQPNDNPYGQPAQPNANPYAQPTQSSSNNGYSNFSPQSLSTATQIPVSAAQGSNESLMLVSNAPVSSQMAPQPQNSAAQFNTGNFPSQQGSAMQVGSHSARPTPNELGAHNNNDVLGGFFSQPGSNTSMAPQMVPPSSTGALAIVPQTSKDKFEPKSAVWADTLSRGLINFNISGPKTNPLADIGVDFDAINRKEKRLEKPAPTAVPSTVTMGKAMGSGSGIGRAGASVLRAPANPMVGSGMSGGMGMGGGPVGGTGMGVYGGMNQQPMGMGMGMNMGMNPGMGMNNMGMNQGMGMNNMGMNQGMRMNMGMNQGMGMNMGMNQGIGMNMGMNPGMGMSMGMGQATHMQSQSGMPGSYNPMMGSSGYPQQPQGGGGYR